MKPSIVQQIERQANAALEPKAFDDLVDSIHFKHNGSYALDGGTLVALNYSHSESNMQLELDVSECASLQYLNLGDNPNLNSLSFAGPMPNLKWLNLGQSGLTELVLPNCPNLEKAWIEKNKLKEIIFQQPCPKLFYLDLAGNQLEAIHLPTGFDSLAYLYLNDNQLSYFSLSDSMAKLDTLHLKGNKMVSFEVHNDYASLLTLYLEDNQIAYIEPNLFQCLPNLAYLTLKGNQIRNLPKEIVDKDGNVADDLRNTLISLGKGTATNYEVKMVLIGNSSVGKTTLVKYLKDKTFKEGEDTTHGIKVTKWEPTDGNGEKTGLVVYVWDFGGQEYYHATHRLFLSNNAVYCLLWNQATNVQDVIETSIHKEGKEIRQLLDHYPYTYWLDNVRHYAPNSPLLLVQSKDKEVDAIAPDVFEKYSIVPKENFNVCIKSVVAGDANKTTRFETFKSELYQKLTAASTSFNLGKFWVEIREYIRAQAIKGGYRWTWAQYLSLCQAKDGTMTESEAITLAKYLTDIGVVLYYPNHDELKDTVFINPIWVTDMIYAIFDESVKDKHGEFDLNHIVNVLKQKVKMKSEQEINTLADELLELMKQFELVFSPKNKVDAYFAVQYLPNNYGDKISWEMDFNAKKSFLSLHFPDFLPKSVFLRFIAEFGRYSENVFWKYGIKFTLEPSKTIVYAECKFKERLIQVWSQKEDTDFTEIYNKLFELGQKNKQIEVSRDGINFVSITELEKANYLGNIRASATNGLAVDLDKFNFIIGKTKNMKSKIFISYAHKDEKFKDELVTHLSSLKNQGLIEAWHDRQIESGLWDDQIADAMNNADIFLLLITPKFLASKYISEKEITEAYKKYKRGEAKIFPIICDFCDWSLYPVSESETEFHPTEKREMKVWLGKFQPYPKDGKPIKKWSNKNEAFLNVIESIKKELKK